MATNVRTDNRNLITQYGASVAVQPADPVLLLPKDDPGIAVHVNNSSEIDNAAGTVFDHGTEVAHAESYLADGQHPPEVDEGINSGVRDGDTGFGSFMKSLWVETRNAVADAVDATVNAVWDLLPTSVKAVVENAEQIVGGLELRHFEDAAEEEAQAMIDALMSTDTLIALAQTAALMGVSAIPVVGQIVGAAQTAQRIMSVIQSIDGAAEQFCAMMERWTQPMSPEQLEEERKKLASFLLNVGVSVLLAALGKAAAKISARTKGRENSNKPEGHDAGKGPERKGPTLCPCATKSPVVIASGEKRLKQTDFSLPGLIKVNWTRSYSSGDVRIGWFGQGWSLPQAMELRLQAGGLSFHDDSGRVVRLPWLDVGAEHFDAYEQLTLKRPETHRWEVRHKNGRCLVFLRARDDLFMLPLAQWADRNGNRWCFEYPDPPLDPFDPWRPLAIDDGRRRLALSWNEQGLLRRVALRRPDELALHVLAEYQYNERGQLVRQRNAAGHERRFGWQGEVLTSYTDADGTEFRAEYDRHDASGRVTRSFATHDGRGLRFEYLDRARATRVTDALGRSTLFEHDDRRDIIAITGPDGTRIATPFDSNGHPRGSTDPLGRQTVYRFDQRGNLTEVIDPSGASKKFDYSALDQPVRITDAMGHAWQREYDALGNLVATIDPLQRITRYENDERGVPVRITDARGGIKRLQWDEHGNLQAYTDCSQRTTRFAHDGLGRIVAQTDALGHETRYEWNEAGQLLLLCESGGAQHRYEWTAEGRLLAYIDPLGARTRWHYNPHGDPIERIDPNGHSLRYEYDEAGRLRALANEIGERTRFAYDIADRLTDEIGFDDRHQRYCYNAAGELTHIVEAGGSELGPGKVTHFERDALGRLTRRLTEDTEARFRYDKLGRLLEAHNAAAGIGFAYDPAGQLLGETQTLPGQQPRVLQHQYDLLGNRIQTRMPDQRALNWLFYGSGHLHQVNLEVDGRHQLISDIERDALHREVARSQGSLASHYEHDPAGRLVKHRALHTDRHAAVALERRYEYDAAGRLTQRHDDLRGNQHFHYDPTGRILQAKGRIEEYFAFDPAGNLLPERSGPQAPIRGNRLKVWQDLRFDHDVHGNVIRRRKGAHEEARYRWNAEHQLVEAAVTRHGVTQTTRYAYDALGRRVLKSDAFGSTRFLWNGDLMVQTQRGTKEALYVYEPNSFVPLATVQDGKIYWYQCDQIGAPLELTDEHGDIVWSADYKVWGQASVRATGTSGTVASRWSGNHPPSRMPVDQPFRFQGQQFDEETALNYNRYRYYDPEVGRFVSQDPLLLAGGVNVFQYAPEPLGWIDPLGLVRLKGITPNNKGSRTTIQGGRGMSNPTNGYSTKAGGNGTSHPVVKDAYDKVPEGERSAFHGECGEADALSQIASEHKVESIEELKGITDGAVVETLRNDGKPLVCCSSCGHVTRALGIRDKVSTP